MSCIARPSARRPVARAAIIALGFLVWAPIMACETRGPRAPAGAVGMEPTRRDLTFKDGGLEFDAVLDVPPSEQRHGWGVLLIGGGMGNDLDWSTPGSIAMDGQVIQTTISGQGHADAPALSAALTRRGFVVLRWSTIARGDPLADQWPVRATPRSLGELLRQTRTALETLRSSGLIERDRVILMGHSLGAARACTLASDDSGVRALALLSPAYFTRGGATPGAFAEAGMKHGEDVLRTRSVRCLAVFGALDGSRAVSAGAVQALAGTGEFPGLTAVVLDGLGHQLAPQDGPRMGPMAPAAIERVAEWAAGVVGELGGR